MPIVTTTRQLRSTARPLGTGEADLDPLIDRLGLAWFALIGEASHGTDEFYAMRAQITRALIEQHGYTAVAIEGDWPQVWRLNAYVHGETGDTSATQALADFCRFPRWMWRNTQMLEFVEWLRAWNDALPASLPRVGLYGLDLYSLHESVAAVVEHLEAVDPQAAALARERYSCFDHAHDSQHYGYAAAYGIIDSCEQAVVEQLVNMRREASRSVAPSGSMLARDARFHAEQNARLVVNAERYYRSMYRGDSSWNLRDTHMADTLGALADHLGRTRGARPRIAVWAHNSHLGDARQTEMGRRGEVNLGQLVRERYGNDARLVGFTTFTGHVTAADNWDEEPRTMRVRPALRGSWEQLLHELGLGDLMLFSDENRTVLDEPLLERAIGVIYRPQSERMSHYFSARLGRQFDAVLHIDRTNALRPLDPGDAKTDAGTDADETFPFGV